MTFDANASGVTALWNMPGTQGAYGVKFVKAYVKARGISAIPEPVGDPPIHAFVSFFSARQLPDGSPCSSKFGTPVRTDNQCWRIPVHHGPLPAGREWLRHAHGTKVHSLYCILYHNRMQASQAPDLGDQLIGGVAGAGVFRREAQNGAQSFMLVW